MSIIKENIPNAAVLVNSMRSIGYEFETAIADIIDNSITAQATNIDVFFPISDKEEIYLQIIDNGYGMTDNELFEAMRFGSVKNQEREKNDLGRFGLGLKTASFSQCKKLTVISKKGEEINGYIWDLDEITKHQSWRIEKLSNIQIRNVRNIDKLFKFDSGTLVMWEKFDTLSKEITILDSMFDAFSRKISTTEKHIALIFHRFLEKDLEIKINNRKIKSVDPFLKEHPKTTIKDEQIIGTKTSQGAKEKIKMQVFILPYHKDLNERDYEKLGGHDEFDNQGFYIYRNQRLMIYGTWFKIKPKAELSKNARIRIDLPNTLDDQWSIDIKKQKAIIPKSLLEQLRKEVSEAVETSKRIYEYKGALETSSESIWIKRENQRNKQINYEINLESPVIKRIYQEFNENQAKKINRLLELIQFSIPYQDIYNAVSEKKEINIIDENQSNVLFYEALNLVKDYTKKTKSAKEFIIDKICSIEPYRSANLKQKLRDKLNE